MQPLPRFWARRTAEITTRSRGPVPVDVWGWSSDSTEDALATADSRVQSLAGTAIEESRAAEYYPGRPVREETLEEITGEGGALLAVLSRNRYGAMILNTDAVLIADVDLPAKAVAEASAKGSGTASGKSSGSVASSASSSRRAGLLGRLFGRTSAAAAPEPSVAAEPSAAPQPSAGAEPSAAAGADGADAVDVLPEARETRERVESFAAAHPDWGVHLHRTFAGFRVLVSDSGTEPAEERSRALLEELGSDPLYVRLCTMQSSYRARLTPKPWRIGRAALDADWPADGEELERRAAWVGAYESASEGRAACRRVWWNQVEPATEAERSVLELHDRLSGADSGRDLA